MMNALRQRALLLTLALGCAGAARPDPLSPNTRNDGADLGPLARALFRRAACGGAEPVPPALATVVGEHCAALTPLYEGYRTQWMAVAMPTIGRLVPADLPPRVVYPFGGGDLTSALATFPAATELTTISLEPAGDIRGLEAIPADKLGEALALLRLHLGKLFEKAHSKTLNLELESKSPLPGQLAFSLAALVAHGYEPVALRYFRIAPDGRLHYLTADEVARGGGHDFDDAELEFRRAGDAAAPIRTLRHIAWNLHDDVLAAQPGLLLHLGDGQAAMMTKAASHLLWSSGFSLIRRYLLDHMRFMISDTTGIPPRFAAPAGFVQDTYGLYEGPEKFGSVNERDAEDFRALFKKNAQRNPAAGADLPFRYGYPDNASHGHLVVTHKP